MCLIFFSLNHHPNYKLIVAANRDEFYDRKTAPAAYWNDYPEILGGRDLEGQGTWMAVTRSGKIALITNYRDPKNIDPQAPSRGRLVSDYLIQNTHPESFLKSVEPNAKKYNGFNLIAGNQDELWYFSNYQNSIQKIENGFYGLSNHLLETPWPKVILIKEKLKPILRQKSIDPEVLLDALYDGVPAPDYQLPETGIGLERERALSSIFIKTPDYGTRCSTVALVDQQDRVLFSERTYDLKTFAYTTKEFQFTIRPRGKLKYNRG